MKRLTAAFSMPVSAKDLHSFGLCCSCEHHLVVIEQANRIKECIKQVTLSSISHKNMVIKPAPLVFFLHSFGFAVV